MRGNTKRQQFYQQIRLRQKQQLFKKLRKPLPQINETPISNQLDNIINRIRSYPRQFFKMDILYDHQDQLYDMIKQMKFIEGIRAQHRQILEFMYKIVYSILGETQMDEERTKIKIQQTQRSHPLSKVLLQIRYFIFNMLAEQDKQVLEYLNLIYEFTRYKYFVQCFHNILLNVEITVKQKQSFFAQFLEHLRKNPQLYFQNCANHILYVYYALVQKPNFIKQSPLHFDIIDRIENGFSFIDFMQKSKDVAQQQKYNFTYYSYIILQKICYKNDQNCMKIVKHSEYVMKNLQKKFPQMVKQINLQKTSPNVEGKPISFLQREQQMKKIEHMSNVLGLVINLSFFDEVNYDIFHSYPKFWAHLIRLFYTLSEIPHKINNQKFNQNEVLMRQVLTQKILKIMGNMITNVQIFEDLLLYKIHTIVEPSKQATSLPQFIQCLLNIFNMFCQKDQKIKIQSLYIVNNIIGGFVYMLQHQIKKSLCINQLVSMIDQTLNNISPLIFSMLRLDRSCYDLVHALIKNILQISQQQLEESEEMIKFQFFRDTTFVGILKQIAYQDEHYFNNCYTQTIRMYAEQIIKNIEQYT